jgi:hypothetical protein
MWDALGPQCEAQTSHRGRGDGRRREATKSREPGAPRRKTATLEPPRETLPVRGIGSAGEDLSLPPYAPGADSVLVEVASTGAGASAPKVAGVGPVSAGASSLSTASIGSFPASSLSQFQSLSLSWLITTARIGATRMKARNMIAH